MLGEVIEVYIPDEYKNASLIDVMDRTLIGFKIRTEKEIKNIVVKQDEDNSRILKGDTVILDNNTIKLLEDEDYYE